MSTRRRWVGVAARTVAMVALLAGVVITVGGVLWSSAVVATNGVLLMVATVLAVGVTYAAVFAREDQLARRASSSRD